MEFLGRPEVIITHESDLDGLLAGLLLQRLARKSFGAAVPLQAYQTDYWQKRNLHEKAAWVSDLSFEARLDKPNWTIIDHHPYAVPPKYACLVHDPGKCASLLCYELCQEAGLGSPSLDRLVHLCNVADLFLEGDPDFWLAQDYAQLVKTYQFWNLHTVIEGNPEKLLDHPLLEVMAVKRRVEDPLGLAWSKANITAITPTVGFVDTVIGNNNLILHQLLTQRDTPFLVLLTMFRKGNSHMVLSLRSLNGDALKIATRLQGGGHPNAAGAILPRTVQNIPEAIEYLRNLLNPTPSKDQPLNSLESLFEAIELKN
jgi:oligoribonuclease NrnB/cAMP/cGMP phosphodiesterase (DHH superfamily)